MKRIVENHFNKIKARLLKRIAMPSSNLAEGVFNDVESSVRLGLKYYREEQRKSAFGGKKAAVHARIARKRLITRKARELLKRMKKGKRPSFRKALLLHSRFNENRLAHGLYPNRKEMWVPILKRRPNRKYSQLVLENFSFIDHPERTLSLFSEILEFEGRAMEAQLHFDDEYCLDVSAYLALAEMWPQLARVFRSGRMSQSIQKVLETLNLRSDLSMRLPGLINTDDIWAFPKRSRRPADSSKGINRDLQPQKREKVADEFVQALDDWLGYVTEDLELTKMAKAHFANIIGELLDNAERHSSPPGNDGGWSTAAFMAKRNENGREVFRCYMGFLSVGATVSDSLGYASISMRAEVNKYLDAHKNSGLSRETLRTVAALQDGITRDANAEKNQRGGVGLQEVLALINSLGYTNEPKNGPRLTIVSGRSCIQARFPYVYGKTSNAGDRRTLWFNEANTPMQPPDKSYVFDLNRSFPGTIIGITFVYSKEDLMAAINANKSK